MQLINIICDISTGAPCTSFTFYIANKFLCTVSNSLHYSISHPSIHATLKLITDHCVWPNTNSDLHKWAQSCLSCQQFKVHKHTKGPLATFATPDARFNQVYSSLAIYHFDRYYGLTPTISIKASPTFWPDSTVSPVNYNPFAPLYWHHCQNCCWIFQFGVPFTVTIATDRAIGYQFESVLWNDQLM